MNFKRFYVNGNRYSFTILYGTKMYRIAPENTWNTWMYHLYLFTTLRFVIVEEGEYFSIYRKYYFNTTFIEKWIKKEDAKKRVSELYKKEYDSE